MIKESERNPNNSRKLAKQFNEIAKKLNLNYTASMTGAFGIEIEKKLDVGTGFWSRFKMDSESVFIIEFDDISEEYYIMIEDSNDEKEYKKIKPILEELDYTIKIDWS